MDAGRVIQRKENARFNTGITGLGLEQSDQIRPSIDGETAGADVVGNFETIVSRLEGCFTNLPLVESSWLKHAEMVKRSARAKLGYCALANLYMRLDGSKACAAQAQAAGRHAVTVCDVASG